MSENVGILCITGLIQKFFSASIEKTKFTRTNYIFFESNYPLQIQVRSHDYCNNFIRCWPKKNFCSECCTGSSNFNFAFLTFARRRIASLLAFYASISTLVQPLWVSLTHMRSKSISYRNQSINLQCKLIGWFLYERIMSLIWVKVLLHELI